MISTLEYTTSKPKHFSRAGKDACIGVEQALSNHKEYFQYSIEYDNVRSTNQCITDSKFPTNNMSIDVEGGASLGLVTRVRGLNKKYDLKIRVELQGTILTK